MGSGEKKGESDEGWDLNAQPGIKPSIYSLTSPHENLGFLFTGKADIIPYDLDEFRRALLHLLDGKHTLGQIMEAMTAMHPDWERSRVKKALSLLKRKGILEPDMRYFAEDDALQRRYDRQLNFFGIHVQDGRKGALQQQKKLAQAHIVIFGIGGFGSHILTGLAHMGIGHITAVDNDTVHISNLNRQILYDEEDIGRVKVDAALEKCQRINSQSQYTFIKQEVSGVDDFIRLIKGADLVILTADTPRQKIFYWLNEAIYTVNVPALFTLGASPAGVTLGPLIIPGQTACFACALPQTCLDPDKDPAARLNRNYRHGTLEPYLMTGVGIMLNEIINYCTGIHPCRLAGALVHINMQSYETRLSHVPSHSGCAFCSQPES